MARYRIALAIMLALIALPSTALAGGWAVTSFDKAPPEFEAGSTHHLEYTILQHGRTPVDVGSSQVRIIDSEGQITVFDAVATDAPGHYAVAVTFPESGTWQWEVTQGAFGVQELGTVEVVPAAVAVGSTGGSMLRWLLPAALALAIGLIAVQVLDLVRDRRAGSPIRAD